MFIRRVAMVLPMSAMMAAFLVCLLPAWSVPAQEKADGSKWEQAIQAFEASDKTNPPPRDAVLFIGSSSIRLWKTLEQDFPGHKVINRGFGGSEIADSTRFADRIMLPYRPKMIFLYAGDNDIAAGKSPERVLSDFQAFVRKVRGELPETPIVFISIKPSLARRKLMDKMAAANALVKGYIEKEASLLYVDAFTPMLDATGEPRKELFVSDGLHMNARGYDLWTRLVTPLLPEIPGRR